MKPTKTDKKPESKKAEPMKVRLNIDARNAPTGDDYWQIDITVSDTSGTQLAAVMLKGPPPPPPINPNRMVGWIRSSLGERR